MNSEWSAEHVAHQVSRFTCAVVGIILAAAPVARAQAGDDVRLELVLKDNSTLRGRPVQTTLKVKTEILSKPIEIVLAKVLHIEHKQGRTGFLVTFTNDDTISCEIPRPNMELVTLLGKVSIPFADIRAVRNVNAMKTQWRAVPNPPPRNIKYTEQVDIACDEDGAVWVMNRSGVNRWDGKKFHYGGFMAGFNLARIFGGPNRGLYVTQFDAGGPKGLLHRITAKRREKPLTDFKINSVLQVPCLHIAATGKVYNWGESFIRVFAPPPRPGQPDGKWKEWEAPLTRRATCVLEVDGDMHFFCNNQVWVADKDDNFSSHPLKLTTRVMKARKGKKPRNPPLVLARWDRDKIVSFSPGDNALQANALGRFSAVDVERTNEWLTEYKLHGAFSSRDGSVFLAASGGNDSRYLLLRLTRDGTVIPLEETRRFLGGRQSVSSVHQDSDDALWLAAGNRGIARYRKRNLRIFGPDEGLPDGRYFRIMGTPNGNIWTLSKASPYVLEAALRDK